MTFGKVLESFKSRLQSAKEDQELYLIDKKSGKPRHIYWIETLTILPFPPFREVRLEILFGKGGGGGGMVGQFCSESKVEFPNGWGWGVKRFARRALFFAIN